MGEEFLTQEEIDALLKSLEAQARGEAKPAAEALDAAGAQAAGQPEAEHSAGSTGEAGADVASSRTLERLLSLPLEVTVILGSARHPLKELMALKPGQVVELAEPYGAPVEVSVNGRPVATGELTVVGDHFGVRLLKLVSPAARARGLGRTGVS